MFEKEAEEYFETECLHSYADTEEQLKEDVVPAFQKGAEFGYNKGYHDAEEHYLNVIDSQHKLVDESKKKDFRKCMKCTDGTYQSGFKDGYNKANEWHYVKDELPISDKDKFYFVVDKWNEPMIARFYEGVWSNYSIIENVIAWKEIVLPELKESE